jgi:hypothetical protein
MGEVAFVLKSLVAAVLLVAVMQVKVSGNTIERHTESWLQTSSVSLYVQKIAAGAVLLAQNSTKSVSNLISKTFSGGNGSSQNRSRLNIEFKRNQKEIDRQNKRINSDEASN